MTTYDSAYMARHGYANESAERVEMKRAQLALIERITRVENLLVAGAACGTEVRAATALGIAATGFDLHAEPGSGVLTGDLSDPATWPAGDFDCLVAIDVLEHVPEDRLFNIGIGLLDRRFPWLALAISKDAGHEGHVTLWPLSLWAAWLRGLGYDLVAAPASLRPDEEATYGIRTFDACWRSNNPSGAILFWRLRG